MTRIGPTGETPNPPAMREAAEHTRSQRPATQTPTGKKFDYSTTAPRYPAAMDELRSRFAELPPTR